MIKTRINNEYKDIIKIFGGDTLQKEITKVWSREANKYVYESSVEYTGALPITITADGSALLDYVIYGNTVQDGTPTPENPIVPKGVGERTGNLFDISQVVTNMHAVNQGNSLKVTIPATTTGISAAEPNTLQDYCPTLNVGDKVTLSFETTGSSKFIYLFGENIVWANNQSKTITDTMLSSTIIWYASGSNTEAVISNIMFNTGSTPLPYEPYGYKLPMTVTDGNTVQTVPVYLGEVETTRRIKKLVLTGKEGYWHKSATRNYSWYIFPDAIGTIGYTPFYCSHGETVTSISDYTYGKVFCDNMLNLGIFDSSIDSSVKLNAYLAAQYAAGTPVTVWYVLSEPETAVVNEPLMKIGDYADTIDRAQATTQIPTFEGTTVIDYDGTPKPSQMYIKYRR